jgi:hypothetical protein
VASAFRNAGATIGSAQISRSFLNLSDTATVIDASCTMRADIVLNVSIRDA